MTAYPHHIIFISITLKNSPVNINDVNFKVDFIVNYQNLTVFCELNLCCIKWIKSDIIDQLPSFCKIYPDTIFTVVSFKHCHKNSWMWAFAENAPILVRKFWVFNNGLGLSNKIVYSATVLVSEKYNDLAWILAPYHSIHCRTIVSYSYLQVSMKIINLYFLFEL